MSRLWLKFINGNGMCSKSVIFSKSGTAFTSHFGTRLNPGPFATANKKFDTRTTLYWQKKIILIKSNKQWIDYEVLLVEQDANVLVPPDVNSVPQLAYFVKDRMILAEMWRKNIDPINESESTSTIKGSLWWEHVSKSLKKRWIGVEYIGRQYHNPGNWGVSGTIVALKKKITHTLSPGESSV